MDEITNPLTDETEFPSDDPWAQEIDRHAERRPASAEADFDDEPCLDLEG